MSDTPKNSPLGINVAGDYLNNAGLTINSVAQSYMGVSKTNSSYTFGTCVSNTSLRLLTWAINDAYNRGVVLTTPSGSSVYDSLISIGEGTIPALGNSIPPTYVPVDPANIWARTSTSATALCMAEQYGRQTGYSNALPGPATTGYGNYDGSYGDPLQGYGVTDQKQSATWYPYDTTNPNKSVTQWGYIRLHALQAWNEFNWNGTVVDTDAATTPSYLQGLQQPEYKDFLASATASSGFTSQNNQTALAAANSKTFLDGTFSNMNDLISGDIAGVSQSTVAFGTDLENLGMALDLSNIDSFGLPSNLLRTLGNQGAITQDLSLVLLASGMTSPVLSEIISGDITNPTEEQERKIYGSFLLMAGENLKAILAPIQCKTKGLQTLADLLNVKKLFPLSYESLTVPRYNASRGPTNSKTYYLIYSGSGVNPALSSQSMREYVGTLVPKGAPPVYEVSTTPKNYREVPKGFDSYLRGIIPDDQATAAGAFSFTMRQIKSIETFNISQFAKTVKGIENVSDLPLVSGTSTPTNQAMADQVINKSSLGSGPFGSYTASDLFGCMSGLPYPWQLIQKRINELETRKLYNIYNQLFLAVTWDAATITVVPETQEVEISPGVFQTQYRVGSLVVNNPGGGYGRGGAPDPVITCSNGGSGTGIIGRSDNNAGSNGTGNYGRVTSTTVTSQGSWVLSPPTATIQCPPTSGLPITSGGDVATGGTNTSSGTTGWPQPMNQVVSAYVQQANEEVARILQANSNTANYLNTYWNNMGNQLMIEQRTRYKALSPVSVPKDFNANPYPTTTYGFIDSLSQFSQDTRPHMFAQTLEAISDLNSVGGQSTVGLMRQERNQARMQLLGIDQDNNIPDTLSDEQTKILTTNGTGPYALPGTGILGPLGEYTLPAWPDVDSISPKPNGRYTPDGFCLQNSTVNGDISQIIEGVPNPAAGPIITTGPCLNDTPADNFPIIIQPAPEYDPTNLPPNLDPRFISSTMLPSVPSVQTAIDNVIACNCDCWID